MVMDMFRRLAQEDQYLEEPKQVMLKLEPQSKEMRSELLAYHF